MDSEKVPRNVIRALLARRKKPLWNGVRLYWANWILAGALAVVTAVTIPVVAVPVEAEYGIAGLAPGASSSNF